jgi:acyl-CoA reductase-like NAD-dependent aldehyde dehydrogenase
MGGAKNHAVIMPDADLDAVVRSAARHSIGGNAAWRCRSSYRWAE